MHVEWYIQARAYRLGRSISPQLLQARQTFVALESSPAAVSVAVVTMAAAAAYSPHQMAPRNCSCVCERESETGYDYVIINWMGTISFHSTTFNMINENFLTKEWHNYDNCEAKNS